MDPTQLRYASSHEWVYLKDYTATVGISRFAVDQLTDLIMIELPEVGTRLVKGKSFGEIESVKAVSDLYAPMTGEVTEVNTAIVENLQLLADDPYDVGWLIKMKVDDVEQFTALMDYPAYQQQLEADAH